jgi:hypothetical protein
MTEILNQAVPFHRYNLAEEVTYALAPVFTFDVGRSVGFVYVTVPLIAPESINPPYLIGP